MLIFNSLGFHFDRESKVSRQHGGRSWPCHGLIGGKTVNSSGRAGERGFRRNRMDRFQAS